MQSKRFDTSFQALNRSLAQSPNK